MDEEEECDCGLSGWFAEFLIIGLFYFYLVEFVIFFLFFSFSFNIKNTFEPDVSTPGVVAGVISVACIFMKKNLRLRDERCKSLQG